MTKKEYFINAATLRVGGGKSVAVNFLKVLGENFGDLDFVAVVPDDKLFRDLIFDNIKLHFVPSFYHNPAMRIALDYRILKILKKTNANKVFNMGNTALPTKKYKQITLFHFPYAIYPESKVWKQMNIKDLVISRLMVFFFKKRLKYSDYFLAQTNTAKNRLIKLYGLDSDKIFIAPNAVSVDNLQKEIIYDKNIQQATNNDKYKCLCLSVYYPHKNIESLIEVAELIKKQNLDIKIYITLDESENLQAKKIIHLISERQIQDILINLGRIPMKNIGYLYSRIDALLLPTILESFSGTYIESMFFKKKIITSDMDFAREVCRYNSRFFDPFDPEDILDKIKESMNSNDIQNADMAYQEVLKMPDWNKTGELIMDSINRI